VWIHNRVANMPEPQAHLDELATRSFLLPPRLPGQAYTFKHILMRDVVYETLLHYNRRILHRLNAEYMEAHYSANLEPHYHSLAENWLAAGEREKAIEFYMKAGESSRRSYDNTGALAAYSQALDLLSDTDRRKCRSFRERGGVNQFIGRTAAAQEDYEKSLALARELQSREEECLSSYSLGAFQVAQSNHKDAATNLQGALSISRETGDRVREGSVLFCMGLMAQDRNQFDQALSYYEQALRMSRETGDRRSEAEILNQVGLACYLQSRMSEAFRRFQEALVISREIGDRLGAAVSLERIGQYYLSSLLNEKAHAYFEQALEVKKEIGDRKGEADLLREMGQNYFVQFRYREAMSCYETALAFARDSRYRSIEATLLMSIGELNKQLGRYEEALQNGRDVLEIDRETPIGITRTQVIITVGVVLRLMGQYDEALRYLEQGLRSSQEIGNAIGTAWTRDNLGELYKDLGQYEKALELFRAVRERSGEMSDQVRLMFDSRAARHIGEIHMNQGQNEEASRFLSEAIACAKKTKEFNEECESLFSAGTLHYLRGEFQEALALCREAASTYERLGVENRARPIRSMEARILAGLGETEAANKVSAPVVQWLRENPSAVFYRDLRSEQIYFAHYLVLKNAGSPDCRDYLDRAYRVLRGHTARISEKDHLARVLGEPLNKVIVEDWRGVFEKKR
jgi:tetratricopeptide (TPR) repeat protein